jgi:hypothetical protein
MTPDGLVTCVGGFSPESMDRLAVALTNRGTSIIRASTTLPLRPRSVMELRPTEVLIFGNARGHAADAGRADNRRRPFRSKRWFGTEAARPGSPKPIRGGSPSVMASMCDRNRRSTQWPMASPRSRKWLSRHPRGNRSGVKISYMSLVKASSRETAGGSKRMHLPAGILPKIGRPLPSIEMTSRHAEQVLRVRQEGTSTMVPWRSRPPGGDPRTSTGSTLRAAKRPES